MSHEFTSSNAKSLYNEAHQIYLDNWETITRFAESDCKWNPDIQRRNHMAILELSSSLEMTNLMLENAMKRIEELEARLNHLLS